MLYKKIFYLLLSSIILIGCSDVSTEGPVGGDNVAPSSDWLIPQDEVFGGGPGRDGIPPIEEPKYAASVSESYLLDNDLIIAVKVGNEIKAFPHPIMDWHEIVNDDIGGRKVSVTYCPLTGSAIVWNRTLQDGSVTTFGGSGLLYNTNLILYDRKTSSNWSQFLLKCVNGQLKGQEISTTPVFETKYSTWKLMYPDSKMLTRNTGFNRPYGTFPYRDYRTNNNYLLFPINNTDNRLPQKDRILGVLFDGGSKVYRINTFGADIKVISDIVGGTPIVVVGTTPKNFAVAYQSTLDDGTKLQFTALQNMLPLIMKDNEGNKWDVFGFAIEGPRKGTRLKSTKSFIAYWFAWATFYQNAIINTN